MLRVVKESPRPDPSPTRSASPSLSALLRERTSRLHAQAERSGVVNDILRGRADLGRYALFVRNLLPVYAEMERCLVRRRRTATIALFARPELRRTQRIVADLDALWGEDWHCELPVLPAAERYAARVSAAGRGDGATLIAHAYVRYFGDLSGGQVLKRLIGGALAIGPAGLSMYEFPGIADPEAAKHEMRTAIDREGGIAARDELIVEEGMRAFEHSIELSLAVQMHALPA